VNSGPFLLRFAEPVVPRSRTALRYDVMQRRNRLAADATRFACDESVALGTELTESSESKDHAEHAAAFDGTVLTLTNESRDASEGHHVVDLHQPPDDDQDALLAFVGTEKTGTSEQRD
jgi:hypothetical protein